MTKQSKLDIQGPLGPKQRWSVRRKREVVLRLLHGEPLDALSREVGVEVYRLEQWREKSVLGMDEALRDRTGDPLQTERTAWQVCPKARSGDSTLRGAHFGGCGQHGNTSRVPSRAIDITRWN